MSQEAEPTVIIVYFTIPEKTFKVFPNLGSFHEGEESHRFPRFLINDPLAYDFIEGAGFIEKIKQGGFPRIDDGKISLSQFGNISLNNARFVR